VDTAEWQSNIVVAEYPLTVEVKNNMFCMLASINEDEDEEWEEGTEWKVMEQSERNKCGNLIPSTETNAFTGRST